MAEAHTIDRTELSPASWFSRLALVVLGTRFVQGFIFWGGASRRLFYDFHEVAGNDFAVKLDFESAHFVAAKLTHGHCQTNVDGAAKGSGLRRSGCKLTPLGQGGRAVLSEDIAAVEVTVVVEMVVD